MNLKYRIFYDNMKEEKIIIKIDGATLMAKKGSTILQTALENGIYIPNLCNHQDLKPFGACRLCLVENTEGRLVTACETVVEDGMKVISENDRINQVRKLVVQLLIANHELDCLTCVQDGNCKLQDVASYMGIEKEDLGGMRRSIPKISPDVSNPFFVRDLKKCILCGICVRLCGDLVGANAIDFGFRGYETKITTFNDGDIIESSCVSCGGCVEACPVGALTPKESPKPSREVKTICPYCGVGCGLYLGIRGEKIVSVRGDTESPVNQGYLCVKGQFGFDFVNHPKRLHSPLVKHDGKFKEVSWEEALDFIAQKFAEFSDDSFATLASAKCTNEENYIFQKFTRVAMGTNNIDHCARLCHAPSVAGLSLSIGSGAMTNSISEIKDSNCIIAIGTNTTSTHPIIGMQIVQAVEKGAKLIVINPHEIDLCRIADIHLQQSPGTDVALIMGIIKVIIDEGLVDEDFIHEKCDDYDLLLESLDQFDLEIVEKITGVNKDVIIDAARFYATDGPASILYAMGITQHSHGTDNVMALSNLALLTGNIGKISSGINPLRGQNNVQGACDMGALPDVYPGYQKVDDPEMTLKFGEAWNSELATRPGFKVPEVFQGVNAGQVKAMYIIGENPVLSEPDASQAKKALESLDFLVVQDIFLTETAQLADVVLPACSFAEKDGTYTNTERRVQRIRKAINDLGDSKPDWWITAQIARKMGFNGFDYDHPSQIFEEISQLTPSYAGISYDRLKETGIQWPCSNLEMEGTAILHQKGFSTANGKGKFIPLSYKPPAEIPDEDYPFILTTGRSLYHYHTGTMSRMVHGLNILHDHEIAEINPEDANILGINHSDVVRIISRRGEVQAEVLVTNTIQKGSIAMTFHFSETPTNILTSPATDPVCLTPELKVSAVRIEKYEG